MHQHLAWNNDERAVEPAAGAITFTTSSNALETSKASSSPVSVTNNNNNNNNNTNKVFPHLLSSEDTLQGISEEEEGESGNPWWGGACLTLA